MSRAKKKADFDTAMLQVGIPEKAIANLWTRLKLGTEKWNELLQQSFLDEDNKNKFEELLNFKKSIVFINS